VAAQVLLDGGYIYLDAGATTYEIFLYNKSLKFPGFNLS